ncbi:hypothetical protein O3W44_24370 [Pantoea sp. LMR881]|uniref:hypothetical protein n=1 Tax=Pantoea sp. LMR881 TaxID=3014336 RepID=UPI0022B04FA9|nr:hypothetical protein [Pantoea sp. LMR881]MCZ4061602.1 hypothetical protein [Pantoea sp. LMR881]
MEWYILETLISPESNTSFSLIVNTHNVHRIVWHEYYVDLVPGKHILLSKGKFMFKGKETVNLIRALKMIFYTQSTWGALKAYTGCEKYLEEDRCTYIQCCAIKSCPRQFHQKEVIPRKVKTSGLH